MKMLLSTTALVVALGLPAIAVAQSSAPASNPGNQQQQQQQQQNAGHASFLSERGQSDLFASELMGHDVYARRSGAEGMANNNQRESDRALGNQANMSAGGSREMTMMNRGDMENMENIGQITEIVLSSDGQVRGLVIGVGGFLGMGEQDVAVSMDQIMFSTDADDQSRMYIVVNSGVDSMLDAPAYDRTWMRGEGMHGNQMQGERARGDRMQSDRAQGTAQSGQERAAFAAPDMQRDGYNRVELTEISTEMLMGKSVYDVNDRDVGSITDMLLDDQGAISNIIIDFGGFLGIGSSQAAIGYNELTILTTEGNRDVRIYVDATREQIEGLPQYQQARN